MFTITGYLLSAGLVATGVFKWKQISNVAKKARDLFGKVKLAKSGESEGGRAITTSEWREIAEESLELLKAVFEWWKIKQK